MSMICSIDAFPVNLNDEIDWKKAIPIDVEPLNDTHCILNITGYARVVVTKEELSTAVLSVR